jgi:hypothetical protein
MYPVGPASTSPRALHGWTLETLSCSSRSCRAGTSVARVLSGVKPCSASWDLRVVCAFFLKQKHTQLGVAPEPWIDWIINSRVSNLHTSHHPSSFAASSPRAYALGEPKEPRRVLIGAYPQSLEASWAIGDIPSSNWRLSASSGTTLCLWRYA